LALTDQHLSQSDSRRSIVRPDSHAPLQALAVTGPELCAADEIGKEAYCLRTLQPRGELRQTVTDPRLTRLDIQRLQVLAACSFQVARLFEHPPQVAVRGRQTRI